MALAGRDASGQPAQLGPPVAEQPARALIQPGALAISVAQPDRVAQRGGVAQPNGIAQPDRVAVVIIA